MSWEIIMAGFGGQGIMFIGQLLTTAGMLENLCVAWTPAYGPEMRGGPANCNVILSADPIGAPVFAQADAALILDQPSLPKFERAIKPEGLLLLNSSLVKADPERTDLRVIKVPGNYLAETVGDARVTNVVMLGAFIALTQPVHLDTAIAALKVMIPKHRHAFLPLNQSALERGALCIEELLAQQPQLARAASRLKA